MNSDQSKNDELTNFQVNPNMASDNGNVNNTVVTPEVPNNPVVNDVPNNTQVLNNTMVNTSVNNVTYDYPEVVEKKSKAPIFILVLLILLGVGGYFLYQSTLGKPYKYIVEGLTASLKTAFGNVNKYNKASGELEIDPKMKELDFLTNLSFNYDYVSNIKDKKEVMNATLLDKNEIILNGNIYLDNDTLYINSKQLFNNPLYLKSQTFSELYKQSENAEDIEHYIDLAGKVIINGLKEEKNNRSSVILSIDSKSVNATANTYVIDKNNESRVLYNMSQVILNDEKAMKAIADSEKTTVEELKKNFDIDKNEEGSLESKIELVFYTKGILNKFIGFAFKVDGVKLMEYLTKDDFNSFVIGEEDTKLVAEGKMDNLKYSFVIDGEETFTGSIVQYSENSYAITAEIPKALEVKVTTKLETSGEVTPIDTTNAVDMNTLTEKDNEAISEKLQSAILKSESLTKLMMLMSEEETN